MRIVWRARDLNEAMRPVAEHISVEAAEAVVHHFGGTRIHVPQVWRDDSWLNVLGEALAREMIAHFAGEVICVPRSLPTSAARVAKARELREGGATVNQIARALGLSFRAAQEHLDPRRTGRKVAKGRIADDRQTDLIDLLPQAGAPRA